MVGSCVRIKLCLVWEFMLRSWGLVFRWWGLRKGIVWSDFCFRKIVGVVVERLVLKGKGRKGGNLVRGLFWLFR